jgi:hypothetical protein
MSSGGGGLKYFLYIHPPREQTKVDRYRLEEGESGSNP